MNRIFEKDNKIYISFENSWRPVYSLDSEFISRGTFHLRPGLYFFIDEYGNLEQGSFNNQDEWAIEIGDLKDEYLILNAEVFNLKHEVRIHSSFIDKLKLKHFVTNRMSNFKKIDDLINEDFIIVPEVYDDDSKNHITFEEYNELIKSFPTKTTLDHYTNKVLSEKIEEHFELNKNYEGIYERHIERREKVKNKSINQPLFSDNIDSQITENEIQKFNLAFQKLEVLLENEGVHEKKWQEEILNIILLIYPHYQFAIDEVTMGNNKRVDFILVDFLNNVDIIEIKRPEKSILRKAKYRDNYVPSLELTGTAMQVEYYIRQLTGNPSQNIRKIEERLRKAGFDEEVQINNVKGMIIMGRTNTFNERQKESYRILKNQFSNIISIISYDELLDILKNIIERFTKDGLDKVVDN